MGCNWDNKIITQCDDCKNLQCMCIENKIRKDGLALINRIRREWDKQQKGYAELEPPTPTEVLNEILDVLMRRYK